jgi:KDPG and KHG aldolase
MTKQEVRAWIEETGVIAAVREGLTENALFAGEAVAQSGIPVVEIALTVPHATMVIIHLAKSVPGIVVGAGSVTNPDAARQCLDAGAQFFTSDGFHLGSGRSSPIESHSLIGSPVPEFRGERPRGKRNKGGRSRFQSSPGFGFGRRVERFFDGVDCLGGG